MLNLSKKAILLAISTALTFGSITFANDTLNFESCNVDLSKQFFDSQSNKSDENKDATSKVANKIDEKNADEGILSFPSCDVDLQG